MMLLKVKLEVAQSGTEEQSGTHFVENSRVTYSINTW